MPHNHYENSFVYPATHDNETTAGWFKESASEGALTKARGVTQPYVVYIRTANFVFGVNRDPNLCVPIPAGVVSGIASEEWVFAPNVKPPFNFEKWDWYVGFRVYGFRVYGP